MAVETAEPSSTSDTALIAEIAPAMLEKLKRDGKDRGRGYGSDLLMVANLGLVLLIFNPDWHPEILDWYPCVIAVMFAAWLALPLYFRKRSVAAELAYRRRHGRWRWER